MKNRFLSEVQIDDILKDAISTFGKQAQLMQAMQDLSELIVECAKLSCDCCKAPELHASVANTRIALRQIEMIAGTNVESGQLCIEIAERDALHSLEELCKVERQCAEPNVGMYDVDDLINNAHISTNNENYVEVQYCNNCKNINYKNNGSEKYCIKNLVLDDPTICLEWERKEQPKPTITTNSTRMATITLSGADRIKVLDDTCGNCIYRSNSKKDNSFIDNYWCAKNEVWIQLQHYCKEFVQRD